MDFIKKECELTVTRKFMFVLDKLVIFSVDFFSNRLGHLFYTGAVGVTCKCLIRSYSKTSGPTFIKSNFDCLYWVSRIHTTVTIADAS